MHGPTHALFLDIPVRFNTVHHMLSRVHTLADEICAVLNAAKHPRIQERIDGALSNAKRYFKFLPYILAITMDVKVASEVLERTCGFASTVLPTMVDLEAKLKVCGADNIHIII